MIPPRTRLLARAELARALRARWFLLYAGLFLLLGLALTALAGGGLAGGHGGALRPFAALVHTLVLFVPVMALVPSIGAVADDRENGLLEYTLAQPVDAGGVLTAKWIGTGLAVVIAVLLGIAPGGAGAILRGGGAPTVLLLLLLTVLLALAFASTGILLGATIRERGRATAAAVGVWLGFVVLGTLGLMTAFVRWGTPEPVLAAWSLSNPVEAFRIAILTLLDPGAGLLGPVGQSLLDRFGRGGLVSLGVASLVAWALVPGLLAIRLFGAAGGRR